MEDVAQKAAKESTKAKKKLLEGIKSEEILR
jgi:hypothetical protein